jgi:hypothetical protein
MNMFGWDRCKDKAKFLKVSPLESVKTFKVLIFKQLQGKFVEKRLKNLAKIRLMGVEKIEHWQDRKFVLDFVHQSK